MKIFFTIVALLLMLCADVHAAETIGVLLFSEEPRYVEAFRGIRDALAKGGYREPTTLFDVRSAGGSRAVAARIVREFRRKGVRMLVTLGTNATIAARRETGDIPILFSMVYDPVGAGVVTQWDKPGTNATGTSPKIPMGEMMTLLGRFGVKRLLVLYTPNEKNSEIQLRELMESGGGSIAIEPLMIRSVEEISSILPPLLSRVTGVYVTGSSVVGRSIDRVVSITRRHRVLTVTHLKDLVEQGVAVGMSADPYRLGFRAGEKGVRILAGHSPADIPVERDKNPVIYVNDATMQRIGASLPTPLPGTVHHVHGR